MDGLNKNLHQVCLCDMSSWNFVGVVLAAAHRLGGRLVDCPPAGSLNVDPPPQNPWLIAPGGRRMVTL